MSRNFVKTAIADSGDEDEVTEFRNNLPAFRGINSVVEINNDGKTKGNTLHLFNVKYNQLHNFLTMILVFRCQN